MGGWFSRVFISKKPTVAYEFSKPIDYGYCINPVAEWTPTIKDHGQELSSNFDVMPNFKIASLRNRTADLLFAS